MSLINKMLQDLEQRHADDTVRSMPQDVRATPMPQRSRAPWTALAVLLAVLVCALLAWRWLRPSAEVRAPVAVAAVSTPAARPTPAAILMPPSAAAPEPAPAPVSSPAPSLALKVDDDLSMKSIAQIPASIAEPSPAAPAAPAPAAAVAAVAAPDVARQADGAAKESNKKSRSDTAPAKPLPDVAVKSEPRTTQQRETAPSVAAPKTAVAEQPLVLNKQVRELNAQQKAENDYRRATTLIQQGQIQGAIALLEQVLQADAAHVGARQTLIALMLNAKRRDEAMRLAQQGLELDIRQPNFAMILARLQLDKGDQKAAIATLQRSLSAAGGNAEYQAFLAALLQREGRNAEAVALYESALDKAPQSGVWWMGLGISLQADNRLPQAREAFVHARDTGSLSPDLQAFVDQKIRQLGR